MIADLLRAPNDVRAAVRVFAPIVRRLYRGPTRPPLDPATRDAWGMPPQFPSLPTCPWTRTWFETHDICHGLTSYPSTKAGEPLVGAFMLGAGDAVSAFIAATWVVERPGGMREAHEWGRWAGPRLMTFPYHRHQDAPLSAMRGMLL